MQVVTAVGFEPRHNEVVHLKKKWARNPPLQLNCFIGGNGDRGGIRTHDPIIKSDVLYRLSYAVNSIRLGTFYVFNGPPSSVSTEISAI